MSLSLRRFPQPPLAGHSEPQPVGATIGQTCVRGRFDGKVGKGKKGVTSFEGICDLVAQEHFLDIGRDDVKQCLWDKAVKTVDEIAPLADDFEQTQASMALRTWFSSADTDFGYTPQRIQTPERRRSYVEGLSQYSRAGGAAGAGPPGGFMFCSFRRCGSWESPTVQKSIPAAAGGQSPPPSYLQLRGEDAGAASPGQLKPAEQSRSSTGVCAAFAPPHLEGDMLFSCTHTRPEGDKLENSVQPRERSCPARAEEGAQLPLKPGLECQLLDLETELCFVQS
ncbi:hypothetical protein UY3_08492 [Chelonia mydas]|uniref:Uncharacterized protein n=1 Tax=Chelonia mydas TaxID=8469 RepID=M7BQI3_CHEMY|nr:hypothetical protein UY3_08492 [Chelonia mydas]